MTVAVHHVIDAAAELPADSPTVVLSNSLGTTHHMWDKQVLQLSRHFRVVRYDTRGHGRSPAPRGPYSIDDLTDDVVALLDHLGLARVHFVGLSLGGMTGMRFAIREPDRVGRLVLLCTSAHLEPESAWRQRAATVREHGSRAVASAVVERWYTERWRTANPDMTAAAIDIVAGTPSEGYASCCEAIASMNQVPDLSQLAAPTLAIAGADDPATPPPHLRLIANSVKDGRLLTVVNAAHLANDEQPAIVTAAVLEHLRANP
jgi:3-oxoadipate enol-lactonase